MYFTLLLINDLDCIEIVNKKEKYGKKEPANNKPNKITHSKQISNCLRVHNVHSNVDYLQGSSYPSKAIKGPITSIGRAKQSIGRALE